MLGSIWDYINERTTFLDKLLFCFGFVMGAGVTSDETSNPFALLVGGLLIGFFCLGMWKFAKAGMRH